MISPGSFTDGDTASEPKHDQDFCLLQVDCADTLWAATQIAKTSAQNNVRSFNLIPRGQDKSNTALSPPLLRILFGELARVSCKRTIVSRQIVRERSQTERDGFALATDIDKRQRQECGDGTVQLIGSRE